VQSSSSSCDRTSLIDPRSAWLGYIGVWKDMFKNQHRVYVQVDFQSTFSACIRIDVHERYER
jgi:hypothetical protein